ncbi:MAG: hypothetical protein KDJ47_08835 [Hyphomicrobiaceae bacterium]|nr:hypothetical protein [Hyphomicrobiaceae bacterium]
MSHHDKDAGHAEAGGAATMSGSSHTHGSRPRAEIARFDVGFAAVAALGELAVVGLALRPAVPFIVPLALHLMLLTVLAYALYRRRQVEADLSAPLLTLISLSAAGPVGAIVSLSMLNWLRHPAQSAPLLDAWYARIAMSSTVDKETQLADRVASGRVLNTRAPPPDALVDVIQNGSLQERQAALGLVARFFHVNYLAALTQALGSDIPVIRVQAAAVASRIRPRLADEVTRRLLRAAELLQPHLVSEPRSTATFSDRLAIMRELDAAIASRLLDKPVEDAARQTAGKIAASIDYMALPLQQRDSIDGIARMHALEAHLLSVRDFQAFRLLARRRDLARRGYLRIRRWPKQRRENPAPSLEGHEGRPL